MAGGRGKGVSCSPALAMQGQVRLRRHAGPAAPRRSRDALLQGCGPAAAQALDAGARAQVDVLADKLALGRGEEGERGQRRRSPGVEEAPALPAGSSRAAGKCMLPSRFRLHARPGQPARAPHTCAPRSANSSRQSKMPSSLRRSTPRRSSSSRWPRTRPPPPACISDRRRMALRAQKLRSRHLRDGAAGGQQPGEARWRQAGRAAQLRMHSCAGKPCNAYRPLTSSGRPAPAPPPALREEKGSGEKWERGEKPGQWLAQARLQPGAGWTCGGCTSLAAAARGRTRGTRILMLLLPLAASRFQHSLHQGGRGGQQRKRLGYGWAN